MNNRKDLKELKKLKDELTELIKLWIIMDLVKIPENHTIKSQVNEIIFDWGGINKMIIYYNRTILEVANLKCEMETKSKYLTQLNSIYNKYN